MSSQEFSLRWNNHTNNLLQVFLQQYSEEWLVDVTLSCQGKFLKAHKMVVAACSPYFKELFKEHNIPHPIIILNGIKFNDLKAIIEFMYKGEIKVLESELQSLLDLGETLQIVGLSRNYSRTEEKENTAKETQSPVNAPSDDHEMESSPEDESPSLNSNSSRLESIAVKVENNSVEDDVDDDGDEEEEELSPTINVNPPEIKDIDAEYQEEHSRLVIDLPENTHTSNSEQSSNNCVKIKSILKSAKQTPTSAPKEEAANESRIPRPPNAFMIFANEWRRKLAFKNPSENNKEISVRLGLMWKSLNNEEKNGYYEAARQADVEHKRKYPGYYYSPKEARLRKRLKRKSGGGSAEALQLVKVLMDDAGTAQS